MNVNLMTAAIDSPMGMRLCIMRPQRTGISRVIVAVMNSIRCIDIGKSYGGAPALDRFHLEVPTGTVCGLLGPNGAGKTTAVRILTTLLRPDTGRAEVAGFDVIRQPAQVRQRIGLVGQHAAVDEVLSGRQNLVMFGKLYHLGARAARARADELLKRFGLHDTGTKAVKDYSGGMRRRLDLAASLITAPPVLFLDEPTTGLDPRGRYEVWQAVRGLVADGATVLLTTQYLEEADQLADRLCVVDRGRVIAEGTPSRLKGPDHLDVVVRDRPDLATAARIIDAVASGIVVNEDDRRISAPVHDRVGTLVEVTRALHDNAIALEDIRLRRPTLDEVFLNLTAPQEVPQ